MISKKRREQDFPERGKEKESSEPAGPAIYRLECPGFFVP